MNRQSETLSPENRSSIYTPRVSSSLAQKQLTAFGANINIFFYCSTMNCFYACSCVLPSMKDYLAYYMPCAARGYGKPTDYLLPPSR